MAEPTASPKSPSPSLAGLRALVMLTAVSPLLWWDLITARFLFDLAVTVPLAMLWLVLTPSAKRWETVSLLAIFGFAILWTDGMALWLHAPDSPWWQAVPALLLTVLVLSVISLRLRPLNTHSPRMLGLLWGALVLWMLMHLGTISTPGLAKVWIAALLLSTPIALPRVLDAQSSRALTALLGAVCVALIVVGLLSGVLRELPDPLPMNSPRVAMNESPTNDLEIRSISFEPSGPEQALSDEDLFRLFGHDSSALGLGVNLRAHKAALLTFDAPREARRLGVISFLSGAREINDHQVIAEVLLTDSFGQMIAFPLVAGRDTADIWHAYPPFEGQMHHPAAATAWTTPRQHEGHDFAVAHYTTEFDLTGLADVTAIQIQATLPEGPALHIADLVFAGSVIED